MRKKDTVYAAEEHETMMNNINPALGLQGREGRRKEERGIKKERKGVKGRKGREGE